MEKTNRICKTFIWQSFWYLTVIWKWFTKRDKNWKRMRWHVECRCICGKERTFMIQTLKDNQKSCWCRKTLIVNQTRIKHNKCSTRIYSIFKWIKQRCNNNNDKRYLTYWAKGIQCLWKDFEWFYKDMSVEYYKHVKKHWEKNTSIDRIDWTKSYYKENCRWATMKEQARNTKSNVFITYNWICLTVAWWVEKIWITRECFAWRVRRWWSMKEIVEIPKLTNQYDNRRY
jgi:hypothetical protein